jgi:integrase
MPRKIVPLTDREIRNAKPDPGKRIKALFDGGGLYLEAFADGTKRWRMKYRSDGKNRLLSFGVYPAVTLSDARAKRESARELLSSGKDPVEEKKAAKAVMKAEAVDRKETFEKAAREWFVKWKIDKAPSNVDRVWGRLEHDVLPWIGKLPVAHVKAHTIFTTCDRIQKRGAIDTAHRVLGYLDAILSNVIVDDANNDEIEKGLKKPRITFNPCKDLRGRNVRLLQPSPPKKHFAHFRDERTGGVSTVKLGEYLRAVDAFSGSLQVFSALRLAPLFFCRPGELRHARWKEIDMKEKTWGFTISKTKPEEEEKKLVLPLSRQAVEILEELRPLTGDGEYVFAGHWDKTRPMSEAAVNAAIRRLGFDTQKEISGHGFRHVASTLLHEQGYLSDAVERSLGHKVTGVKGQYDHAQYLEQRIPMMQAWADYLDKLKAGAAVVPLRA